MLSPVAFEKVEFLGCAQKMGDLGAAVHDSSQLQSSHRLNGEAVEKFFQSRVQAEAILERIIGWVIDKIVG